MKKKVIVVFLLTILTLVFNLNIVFAEECDHIDNGDFYNNLCDNCLLYLGESELVLGENNVSVNSSQLIRFIPLETAVYNISSTPAGSPYCSIYLFVDYDVQLLYMEYAEVDSFYFTYEFVEGETYYLSFGDFYGVESYTVTIDKHKHSYEVETCKGYLCKCGEYFGEGGQHRLSDNQTCKGYECIDCYEYFGDTAEHQLDTEQTCGGYKCNFCNGYFGEALDIPHIDEDSNKNLCDVCNNFLGEDLVLGENNIKISNGEYYYFRFIPEESGNYWIYTNDYSSAYFLMTNSSFEYIEYNDISSSEISFSINVELVEKEVYYLEAYMFYEEENEFVVNVSNHTHSGINQTCVGYHCETCNHYYGECNDEHNLDSEQTCVGYYCYLCHEYIGEGDPYKHNFYDGECEYCWINEEDYECVHEPDGEQTCKGYLCKHCWEYYGECNDEHKLDSVQTCQGYECLVCYEFYGEVDKNKHMWSDGICYLCYEECEHHGGNQTCKGYICEECSEFYGEADGTKHIWYYGSCEYHSEVAYPEDLECDHNFNDHGNCKTCGYSCEHVEIDSYGKCEYCDYQQPFSVTTNGTTTFHNSLKEALDASNAGSYVKMLKDGSSESLTFEKDIIFDINGCEMYQPSSYRLNVNANVTFVDSVGNGYIDYSIFVYASCLFESGSFGFVQIDDDYLPNTYLVDIIHKCTKVYCDNDIIELKGNETFMTGIKFVTEHKDANSDHICDNSCNKIDIGVHEDKDLNHKCDYGCEKAFGEHLDGLDNDHLCDYSCGKQADDGCYDENNDDMCDECNLELNHSLGNYSYDDEGHFKKCEHKDCDYTSEKETHQYGDWITTKEATETEKGLKTKKCECGHEVTEVIPMLEQTPEPSVNNGLPGGAIVGIILGSTLGVSGLFAALWFILRKKFL